MASRPRTFSSCSTPVRPRLLGFIKRSRQDFVAKTVSAGAIAFSGMAVLMFISVRIANVVSEQIKDQIAVMKRLSDGDTNVDTPIPDRRDEIADLAHGVAAFKTSLLEQAAAKELAEQANLAKSVFLANMSHELRTPLHGILSFANFGLKNGATAEPQKLQRYFGTIHDSGMILLRLVNDVLDLAKLEAGKMSLDKRQVDIKALVAKVVDEFESMTRDKKVAIQLLNFDNNHKIQADPTRIMQVVRNLLSNALKFSPEQASVSISAREEHNSLLVSVADEGPGIPANEVEAIFDKFIQSSKTRTGAGGTGLGLAICREIIAVHGGRIWAENNPGRGAVFYFALPLAASDEIEGGASAGSRTGTLGTLAG